MVEATMSCGKAQPRSQNEVRRDPTVGSGLRILEQREAVGNALKRRVDSNPWHAYGTELLVRAGDLTWFPIRPARLGRDA